MAGNLIREVTTRTQPVRRLAICGRMSRGSPRVSTTKHPRRRHGRAPARRARLGRRANGRGAAALTHASRRAASRHVGRARLASRRHHRRDAVEQLEDRREQRVLDTECVVRLLGRLRATTPPPEGSRWPVRVTGYAATGACPSVRSWPRAGHEAASAGSRLALQRFERGGPSGGALKISGHGTCQAREDSPASGMPGLEAQGGGSCRAARRPPAPAPPAPPSRRPRCVPSPDPSIPTARVRPGALLPPRRNAGFRLKRARTAPRATRAPSRPDRGAGDPGERRTSGGARPYGRGAAAGGRTTRRRGGGER